MADLADRLDLVRHRIATGADVNDVVAELEAAGAAIGALQIGCCAPNRLPRYAGMLRELTTVQRLVTGIDT